jgi:hypothetical protein
VAFEKWWRDMIKGITMVLLPPSKGRSNARVVKRRTKSFPSKKGKEIMNVKQDYSVLIVK